VSQVGGPLGYLIGPDHDMTQYSNDDLIDADEL